MGKKALTLMDGYERKIKGVIPGIACRTHGLCELAAPLAGVRILEPVDHTVMRAFYLVDPDDHIVELGVDVPQSEWGPWPNPFGRDVAYPKLLSLADGRKLSGSARIGK